MYRNRLAWFISMASLCVCIVGQCTVMQRSMVCLGDIPASVPGNIETVTLSDEDGKKMTLPPQTFSHPSWGNVNKLDLKLPISSIANSTFQEFKHLSALGIHFDYLKVIERLALNGLLNLVHLDLSGCRSLDLNVVVDALQHVNMPHLRFLNLQHLHSIYNYPIFIGTAFVDMLVSKNITYLNIGWTSIVFKDAYKCQELAIQELHIPNVAVVYAVRDGCTQFLIDSTLAHLKTINISNNSDKVFGLGQNDCPSDDSYYRCPSNKLGQLMLKLENLYANYMSLMCPLYRARNVTVDLQYCEVGFKIVHLRASNIRYVDITILWPENNHLNEIDLSLNAMAYLSPGFFSGLNALTRLDLSFNNLYLMSTTPEFEHLFQFLPSLTVLNLSHNKLSSIPRNMFANMTQLTLLDLSYNKLTLIDFNVIYMHRLKILTLSYNEITRVSDEIVPQFHTLFDEAHNNNNTLNLDLVGNHLQCTCESAIFLELLVRITNGNSEMVYRCVLQGNIVVIDTSAVESSKYLCIRNTIIIASSVSVLTAVASACISVYCVLRRRMQQREKRLRQAFIDNLNVENGADKYIAFLSYDFENSDNTEEDEIGALVGTLEDKLRDFTGQPIIEVCLPDKHFRAGYSDAENIERSIEQSRVVLIKVSAASETNFSFRTTVNLVQYNPKPVVFLTRKGSVYVDKLVTGSLDKHRSVDLTQANGSHAPEHGWNHLCELIVQMAFDNARHP